MHPGNESLQAGAIVGQLGGSLRPLGEGAVVAAVVATGQRPTIEDRQVHFDSYSSIKARTCSEKNHGPSASDHSSPVAVGRQLLPLCSSKPISANVRRSGKSSAG